jgi:uncharacterized protein (TIGR02145 family)
MRQKDLKYFGDIQSGRMNSDDSPFAITTNEWVNAENVRTGTTDKGVTGVVESIGGNVEIPVPDDLLSVVIGDQKWSLQNLNVDKYRDGTPIPEVSDPTAWAALTTGAWCWYDNDEATGIRLYNWDAVNDPRGLAPTGWWIPTQYEWQQLSNELGGDTVSGGKLKQTGTVNWSSPNIADNSSGFTALGCGQRDYLGNYSDNLQLTRFWTATEYNVDRANTVSLFYDDAATDFSIRDKQSGYSVRVVTFNSQYITIGSIEDTENNRFVYFDYDTIRSHQVPITNITLLGTLFPATNLIFTYDLRASVLKAGDGITIINGAGTAVSFTIISIIITDQVSYPGGYKIELSDIFPIDDSFTTDIFYTAGGEDKIVCMYTDTNIQYNVLTSSQVIGGLNFDKNSLIHSAHIANGILSFPDGTNNEPRKINIESGISANYSSFVTDSHTYTFPLNFDEITLIKRPTISTPNFIKDYDALFTKNFINNESFEFAFQYQYYDYETSVIGSYSASSRLNFPVAPPDNSPNRIVVTMDLNEEIPNTVKIINLIVRSSDTNYAFIARTWDKDNPDDLNDIENHNNNIGSLTYNFYNTTTGIVIPEVDVLRPFDNIPIYSQTHEIAKQRYFLGNNIDGYDTPLATSMEIEEGSVVNPTVTTRDVQLIKLSHGGKDKSIPFQWYGYSGWYFYLPWASTPGWYLLNGYDITDTSFSITPPGYPTPPAPPASITYNSASLTFKGKDVPTVINNTIPLGYRNIGSAVQPGSTIPVYGISIDITNAFPQLSTYKCGIVFYDYAMRKCGVVTNSNCSISTKERDYEYTEATDSFKWTLNNTGALFEIPDWAYFYAPVLTKNQDKRFFIQSFTNKAKYFSRDATGVYIYDDNFLPGSIGVALNTNALNQSGLGYIYTEGDVCILTKDLGGSAYETYTLNVIGQDGDYILLQSIDLGSLATIKFVYEIYTPYKSAEPEPFYEMGDIYNINNPKTEFRTYSQLEGFFIADSYILSRTWDSNQYFANAMSPNDLFYKIWATDTGKVNVITRLGQANNNTEVVWSDTYISGTQINGSSTFRLGSQTFVSDDCGSINKLQNTSKVQDQGSVMLALCAVETNSLYLGETQITDSTGGVQFFSSGTNVIGTINILKGNYGCIDPASVVQYRGNVYFLDVSNGRWVQYSANGLDSISAIKMTRFWKNWCYKYMSLTKAEIEAFGNRPYVFATVDPSHDELLITIPKLDNTPPKGFLPDYPELVYPFDILDYQGKTISYKLGTGAIVQPHWQSAYTFNTEYFCTIQNRLFSFNEGNAWEHNQDSQNVFFGVYSQSRIMFTSNILPQMPKVYDNFLSESNIVPSFVYFYNEFPYLQTSDLTDDSFVQKEGIWYAQILRNKVVPTTSGDVYTGLLTAEVMRNTNMFVLAQYSPTSSPLQLRILELGMSISKGHIV